MLWQPVRCGPHRCIFRSLLAFVLIVFLSPGVAIAQALRPVPADTSTAVETREGLPRETADSADSLRNRTYPPRYTARWFGIGAVTGAAVGTAYFTLMFALFNSENEESVSPVLIPLIGLLAGVGLVAPVGGALGGVLGSVNYKPGTEARRFPRGLPIGNFSVQGWRAGFPGDGPEEGGPGARASLTAQIWPWIAFGPEFSLQRSDPSNWRLAGLVRVEPTRLQFPFRPYLIGSCGGNFWEGSRTYLGADAGGGVHWRPPGRGWGVELEGRYHWNVQNGPEPGDYSYTTFGGGLRWVW